MITARILGIMLALAGGLGIRGWQTVFRSTVNYVEVDVSVNSKNRPVTGLTAGDFELRDNGVAQKILVMDRETYPVDVTLAIDVSSSVRFVLTSLVNAVNRIRENLHSNDRVMLLVFNQRILERAALAPPSSLGWLTPGSAAGSTSLYDAITVAMAVPQASIRRQMAIVFTDGLDTISFLDQASALEVARHTRTAIFVVTSSGTDLPKAFSRDLVEITGGMTQEVRPYQPVTGKSILGTSGNNIFDSSFLRALEDFRSSYVLRYTLEGTPSPGWHDLTVRVVKPGTQYQVRARRGYVGR